jgi:DNA modification methylase
MKVQLSQIKISRERFRDDLGDVDELMKSLSTFGLLQPIIVDDKMELLDGFRRFTAAGKLGWQELEATLHSNVDEILARQIELETGIRQKRFTWQEEVKAIAEIDRLRRGADPNWTQRQTAEVAGVSERSRVAEAITLSRMIELFPEIGEAKSLHQAQSWAQAKAKTVTRVSDVKSAAVDYHDIEPKIILGDSVEVIKTIPAGSFHAVITDPPFGIGYDQRNADQIGSLSSYEDSEESYRRLLSMAPDIYRVLKDDGWLIWFLGFSWYEEAKQVFRDAGFIVDEIPIVWDRSDGRTFTSRPDRYFSRGYDIALHALKGNPQIVQRGKPNVLRIEPVAQSERELLVERPVELYEELIRRLTVPGEIVADFFVGSGSCPAAAVSTGRDFFGVELSPERRAYALQKIKNYTPSKEG